MKKPQQVALSWRFRFIKCRMRYKNCQRNWKRTLLMSECWLDYTGQNVVRSNSEFQYIWNWKLRSFKGTVVPYKSKCWWWFFWKAFQQEKSVDTDSNGSDAASIYGTNWMFQFAESHTSAGRSKYPENNFSFRMFYFGRFLGFSQSFVFV